MGFWGLVVESGKSEVVEHDCSFLHLAQASLGEIKKEEGSEPVMLTAKVGDQKFVVGRLSEKVPQLLLDLVFDKPFELSHNWKNGSVHFTGYIVENSNSESDSDSEDENVPIPIDHGVFSGNLNLRSEEEEKVTNSNNILNSCQRGSRGPSGDEENDSSSDDESDSDDEELVNDDGKSSEDEDESEDGDGSEDEESDDSEEEDEEKKVEIGKKRPAEAATPTTEKKAKLITPEKTDSKSGGSKVRSHVPTPHPAKQAKKTAAISGKAFPCTQCSRSFGSDIALQSHTKAKHAPAK
ncbi:histone deacetylase HDT1-like [Humulus lupulus]|uniref:histone deacetylase HDT1-like n=1 Tax=Humulus lupulus TaxID=3486 RepID=UPI002B4028F6|nr:histone deacetylase HDT1-like [Humulus lupulus]